MIDKTDDVELEYIAITSFLVHTHILALLSQGKIKAGCLHRGWMHHIQVLVFFSPVQEVSKLLRLAVNFFKYF